MIIEQYFKVHFVRKQTKGKFATFEENHTFPLEKSQYCEFVKSIFFFSLERLVFLLDAQQTLLIFKAHFVSKQTKRKIPFFDLNYGLTLLEKSSLVTL